MARLAAGLAVAALCCLSPTISQAAEPADWRTATELPRIDLVPLSPEERALALDFLRAHDCTCGCVGMRIAECALLDLECPAIPPIGRALVEEIPKGSRGDRLRALALSAFPLRRLAGEGPPRLGPERRFPTAGAPWVGREDARVTLAVFTDLGGTASAQMLATERALVRDFGSRVRFVFKFLPSPHDPDAWLAAQAALAAERQGAFWPAYTRIFEMCGLVTHHGLVAMASDLGLDVERFAGDLADPALRSWLEADRMASLAASFESPPAYAIDYRSVGGSRTSGTLLHLLLQQLGEEPPASDKTAVGGSSR